MKCSSCGANKDESELSKSQLRKSEGVARCKACVEAGSRMAAPSSNIPAANQGKESLKANGDNVVEITPVKIARRPQIPAPCFDGRLTVAADWPRTGRISAAQSAIFMPLLACVFGQGIDAYCTTEQIDFASQWWAHVFPEWPVWVQKLRAGGYVLDRRESLLRAVGRRSQPNPLIPRTRGLGFVPHIPGKLQTECLSSAPDVQLELDVCVACLYNPPPLTVEIKASVPVDGTAQ